MRTAMRNKIDEKAWWAVVAIAIITLVGLKYTQSIEPHKRTFERNKNGSAIIPFGKVNLVIPENMRFRVEPEGVGPIYDFETWRDYDQLFVPHAGTPPGMNSLVRIQIRLGGHEAVNGVSRYFDDDRWVQARYINSPEIVEYQRAGEDHAWGSLTYIVTGPERTPKGNPIVFRCTRKESIVLEADICETSWQHPDGPVITYFQSGAFLLNWRLVRADVENFVNSVIVKK